MLPSLFISHGAPTFALEPGEIGARLTALGRELPKPRAVVVISPHWITAGLEVATSPQPQTIHDFGGFPEALYRLEYPAAGSPAVAAEVVEALAQAGFPARSNPHRGLDHGAWVPLMHLYPKADVPVVQLSLPMTSSYPVLLALGRALAPLRQAGILVLASGSITHNLHDFRLGSGEAAYAREFMEWVAQALATGDTAALLDLRRRAPHAQRAHPTDEHLQPLLIALGAAGADGHQVQRLDGGIVYGVIGMDAYLFGQTGFAALPAAAARETATV